MPINCIGIVIFPVYHCNNCAHTSPPTVMLKLSYKLNSTREIIKFNDRDSIQINSVRFSGGEIKVSKYFNAFKMILGFPSVISKEPPLPMQEIQESQV